MHFIGSELVSSRSNNFRSNWHLSQLGGCFIKMSSML